MKHRAFLATASLAILASLLLLVLRHPPSWRVPLGAGESRFHTGFTSQSAPWVGPGARLLLHGSDAGPFVLTLKLRPDPRLAGPERVLELRGGSSELARLPLAPEWGEYHVDVASLPPAPGILGTTPIELSCPRYVPGDAEDLRCVRVAEVRVEPRGADWTRPLVRTFWLTALVAVLAAGACRLAAKLKVPRGFAAALAGAVGSALVVWAARSPYTLAWAFPPLPYFAAACGMWWLMRSARGRGGPWAFWSGLGLVLLAQGLGWSGMSEIVAASGLAAGLLLLAAVPPASAKSSRSELSWGWSVLLVILVGAALMRFLELRELPFGLWRDEARHGLVALRILEDPAYRPVYVAERGVNMPALGLYPFTVGLLAWGIQPWSLRPLPAAAGVLSILSLYLFARALMDRRDVPLLAAGLAAASSWHTAISRYAFPTIFDPLLTLTALWLMFRCYARKGGWWPLSGSLASGVLLGLAMQTYHAGKIAPVLGLAALAYLIVQRGWNRPAISALGLGLALTVLPMALYAFEAPAAFGGRVRQVLLLETAYRTAEPPLAALDASLGRHLSMFNLQGDASGRLHPAKQPMLECPAGLLFVLGLAVAFREPGPARLVALLLGIGLLPGLFAVDAPNAMRTVGALAPACLLAGIGGLDLAWRIWPAPTTPGRAAFLAGTLGLAFATGAWCYFGQLATTAWRATYPVHTAVGAFVREMRTSSPGSAVYVDRDLVSNSVMAFLTHGMAPQTFSAQGFSRPPREGDVVVVSGPQAGVQTLNLRRWLREAPVHIGPRPPGAPLPTFWAYRVETPTASPVPP